MKRMLAATALLLPLAAAQAQDSVYINAPVVLAEPIVEVVTRKIPHEYCRNEQVRVVNNGAHSATPGLLGAVVGGVVGGAAGSDSRYQPVIAGAGALLGASIGTDIAHRQSAQAYYVNERRCDTEYELRDIERVVGYRVGYEYQGNTFYTRTASAPGNTIRLRVDVSPEP
ncbi:glycine zipper 2TM domain-containing protein [Haliea sp. E17]|uniref:glycine zipper 2TM domain-containing protein n=1 Tax=Haliea sp. E17 TaxID=3401576 RepID=UPI003AAD7770